MDQSLTQETFSIREVKSFCTPLRPVVAHNFHRGGTDHTELPFSYQNSLRHPSFKVRNRNRRHYTYVLKDQYPISFFFKLLQVIASYYWSVL